MKASTFFSILILSIVVVCVLEFNLYNYNTITGQSLQFDTFSEVDTLKRGTFQITGVNSAFDTIKVTINTTDFISHDNMVDGVGNSSTCWHGYNEYSIKTTNSIPMYIIKHSDVNWSGWYEVINITEE